MFVVRFMGGFANQLFQYALYLGLKEKYPDIKIFADITPFKYKSLHGGFKLDRFVSFEYFDKDVSKFVHVTEDNFDDIVIKADNNYFFDGYWQDSCYFPKDISPFKTIFDVNKLTGQNSEYLREIKSSSSVSIHVRRGDYVHDYLLGNVATKCFYENAIRYVIEHFTEYFKEPVHFFVFSDDIKWCMANLDFGESRVTFVQGNNDNVENDIILMSQCRDNIISNSTFSWWASYLNENSNKRIIMPDYWFSQPTVVKEIEIKGALKLPNTPVVSDISGSPYYSFLILNNSGNKTFKRLMSSVLNQTFMDIEIVLINTDKAATEIISDYMERDKRIKLIDKTSCSINISDENGRLIKNEDYINLLKEGINGITGKKVIIPDPGDYVNTDMCSVLSQKKSDGATFDIMIKPGNAVPDINVKNRLYMEKSFPDFFCVYSGELLKNNFESYLSSVKEQYGSDNDIGQVLYYHMDYEYADKTREKRTFIQKVTGKIKRLISRE